MHWKLAIIELIKTQSNIQYKLHNMSHPHATYNSLIFFFYDKFSGFSGWLTFWVEIIFFWTLRCSLGGRSQLLVYKAEATRWKTSHLPSIYYITPHTGGSALRKPHSHDPLQQEEELSSLMPDALFSPFWEPYFTSFFFSRLYDHPLCENGFIPFCFYVLSFFLLLKW